MTGPVRQRMILVDENDQVLTDFSLDLNLANISATTVATTGAATVGGALTVTGAAALNGSNTLGDAAGDSHVIKGSTKIAGTENAGSLTIDRIGSLVDRFRIFVGDGTTHTADDPVVSSVGADFHIYIGAAGATRVISFLLGGGFDLVGEARVDSLRIDQAKTTGTLIPDSYFVINLNGTSVRVPCIAGS